MPVKPLPLADGKEYGRFIVIVTVLVRVATSLSLEPIFRLVEAEGTGDNVTVVTPIVMLSGGVRFDNQVVVPLLAPMK